VVWDAHNEAVEYILKVAKALNRPLSVLKNDELMIEAFSNYFKIDLRNDSHGAELNKVISNINTFAAKADSTIYRCNVKKSLYCGMGKHLAIVPPPKVRVHLCPSYFRLKPEQQVGTIIHEWGHRWGRNQFDYIDETYCHQTNRLERAQLIRQPDMYMLFSMFVARDGVKLNCF
jgi:hypothetical protein